jgi:glutamyl-tRNA synthetase/glutamyl-Q tRNA(Asp) synthetase
VNLGALPAGFTTRFAPAPTGHLHIGHVVNAVWVWGLARARGGRVLLRIEDHDRGRCRPEYERSILDDLDWLGLIPDGAGTDDFRAGAHPQRQSDAADRYATRLRDLETRGLAYPCLCSRADIARANGGDGFGVREPSAAGQPGADAAEGQELRYPGTCRHLAVAPGATSARRVLMRPGTVEQFDDLRLGPQGQDPDLQCGDLLARDRRGNFTYQFAVVVDDLDQHVNLVIRGEDLLASTGRQLRLARLLGRSAPIQFLHHPLIRHPDGRKLSKSAGDTGVRELRASGVGAAELLGRAAALGGLPHDGRPIVAQDLARLFP